jgi:hypothetical protein
LSNKEVNKYKITDLVNVLKGLKTSVTNTLKNGVRSISCERGIPYLIDAGIITLATEQRAEEENWGMDSEEEGYSNCFSYSMTLQYVDTSQEYMAQRGFEYCDIQPQGKFEL